MNHATIMRKRAGRIQLLFVAALVAGLGLSVWPTPSVRAATPVGSIGTGATAIRDIAIAPLLLCICR